jgi:hypothetical protein
MIVEVFENEILGLNVVAMSTQPGNFKLSSSCHSNLVKITYREMKERN